MSVMIWNLLKLHVELLKELKTEQAALFMNSLGCLPDRKPLLK